MRSKGNINENEKKMVNSSRINEEEKRGKFQKSKKRKERR